MPTMSRLLILPLLAPFLLGCATLESDYAKPDLTPATTFDPRTIPSIKVNAPYSTGSVDPANLTRADDAAVARFAPDSAALAAIDLHLYPADFNGNHRYDGFDVTVATLDANSKPIKKSGSLIIEVYRFNPDVISTLGGKLLVWSIPESELLPTWESDRYHFHLSWWRVKPRDPNLYVVMVATFVSRDGTTFSQTKAPVSVFQPRYEKAGK